MKNDREQKIIRTTLLGVILNMAIAAVKIAIGLISGSVAIISDGANNATDTLSSIVTLVGLKLGRKRPDKAHPLGHGRFEYLSALAVAFIILITGLTLLKNSILAIKDNSNPVMPLYMIAIISITVIIKLILWQVSSKAGKETNSEALIASGKDALSDSAASLITILAALLSPFASFSIDGIAGILVSIFILYGCASSLKSTISSILGERPEKKDVERIREIIKKYPPLHGAYDVMIHQYGPEIRVGMCNVEVPSDATAEKIFDAMSDAQKEIYETMGLYLTLGMYAVNDTDPTVIEMKEDILDILKCIDKSVLSIHGFHIHFKRMLVHFDVVVDFSLKDKADFERRALDILGKCYRDYSFEFNIDPDYS